MAWPGHVKNEISAEALMSDIIATCNARLLTATGVMKHLYELILAHALLDRVNHNHGLLRDLVDIKGDDAVGDGSGLDTAHDQVAEAYNKVMLPAPTLGQLQAALLGIDHGGGGG
jgi:hypothetical protein